MCPVSITLFECYKQNKTFWDIDRRKLSIGQMFLKARNTFLYKS